MQPGLRTTGVRLRSPVESTWLEEPCNKRVPPAVGVSRPRVAEEPAIGTSPAQAWAPRFTQLVVPMLTAAARAVPVLHKHLLLLVLEPGTTGCQTGTCVLQWLWAGNTAWSGGSV